LIIRSSSLPKGYARHAARIKVAIDPPDTLDVTAVTTSVAVHDGSLVDGKMPPALLRRGAAFHDLNREPIHRYWSSHVAGRARREWYAEAHSLSSVAGWLSFDRQSPLAVLAVGCTA
jgi:hypothetical protein